VLTLTGAGLTLAGRRRRWAGRLGAVAILAGALSQRLCVLQSGRQSATDPRHTLLTQAHPASVTQADVEDPA
jgi:hypothetical protein